MTESQKAAQPRGLFVLLQERYDRVYGGGPGEEIAGLVDLVAELQEPDALRNDLRPLKNVELLFTSWGAPRADEPLLAAAPNLKIIFYGAGSVRSVVTEAMWDRGVRVVSAWAANGVPVAEYALSQILFCLRCGWQSAAMTRNSRTFSAVSSPPCAFGSTVGIISLGMIGRLVCEHLKRFDVDVIAYDPCISGQEAEEIGVELCGLGDVFRRADVVSVHTPWLKETEGMITGEHFASMKPNASFINTSRGAVVREAEMIEVLRSRPDLHVVLDVTHPEPPEEGSALYDLPNVTLTPHIAGSLGPECRRMGWYMVDELRRYLSGEPFRWEITREKAAIMA